MAGGRPRRTLALVVAAAALAGGCSEDGRSPVDGAAGGGAGQMETPTFVDEGAGDPVPTSTAEGDLEELTATTGSGPTVAPSTTVDGGDASTTITTATGSGRASVAFDDPVGDATPGVGSGAPPAWSDLAGASLERQNNAYRLSIRLGGAAPETAPGAETMNIATYFDTDRDGDVEYELWVNLGVNGWGPVWYDDEGNAAPGDRSNVTVVVDGDRLRLLFPDVMLDRPDRLRFSVASEYGPLSAIGSATARRDDAPDDDRAVAFP